MFTVGGRTRIWLATGATDLRRGFNGLHALIAHEFGQSPLNGDLYLFTNRRRDLLKIFFFDASGIWVCAKRLETGSYRWPRPGERLVTLQPAELHLLLSGIDLRQTQPPAVVAAAGRAHARGSSSATFAAGWSGSRAIRSIRYASGSTPSSRQFSTTVNKFASRGPASGCPTCSQFFFLRTAARKKKNWLFIGHPDAGQRSAILYSIIVSCQRHGKDPLAYLRDLLTRLPRLTNSDDLTPLLPRHWTPPLRLRPDWSPLSKRIVHNGLHYEPPYRDPPGAFGRIPVGRLRRK